MKDVGIETLGSGFISEFHALGLRYVPAARVVANYGAGAERREAFAERFGSVAVNSIIDAAYRSMRSGRWESVEPAVAPAEFGVAAAMVAGR